MLLDYIYKVGVMAVVVVVVVGGGVKGCEGVYKFLGLKYATISERFEDSEIFEGINIDGTEYRYVHIPAISSVRCDSWLIRNHVCSPSVIQPKNAIHDEFNIIQQSLPIPDVVYHQDEFNSLTLNITVPTIQPGRTGLPVFVWIHGMALFRGYAKPRAYTRIDLGGRFITGSNSWPHYDHARFVELSVELGMPVIGVGIKYGDTRPLKAPHG